LYLIVLKFLSPYWIEHC